MTENILYLLFLATALLFLLWLPRRRETKRNGILLLALSLLLELLVFNYQSFALIGGRYTETAVDLNGESVTLHTSPSTVTAELEGLDLPVGTVYLDCTLPARSEEGAETSYVDVRIDATDETQSAYYRSGVAEGQIIRGNDRSAYIVLNLSGKVSALRIRLTAEKDTAFVLNGITLNRSLPVQLSPVRLLLLLGLFGMAWLLAVSPEMKRSYADRRRSFRSRVAVATALLMLAGVVIHFLCQYDRTLAISAGFRLNYGNQITKELVDAFQSGQVSLLATPPEELLELDNPYDWSQRTSAGISYLWDHLLYDGKYYSYYGIAPVLLLFLPYHLLTGYYFPTSEAVLLFGLLGILFLSLLYLAFCELFAKRVPQNILLSGLLICQLSGGVWYNFCSPLFYEIAQASGFCFTCAGWYLLLRSGVIGKEGRVRPLLVLLSTVCLSLAVLSRPTLALYCIAALPFLGYGLIKHIKTNRRTHPDKKTRRFFSAVGYLAAATLGFAALGGLQMWYNYARFGSVMDFGIQYSLTVNDFTKAQFHIDHVWIGFYNFLLAPPSILPQFPFVFSNFSDLGLNGYYFIANRNAVGLCFRALPILGYLAIPAAWRALDKKERAAALWLLLPLCLIAPLGIIASIWESGYGVRYSADFAWQLILGGIAVLLLLYVRRAEPQTKRILQGCFAFAALVALLCNFGMIWEYMDLSRNLEAPAISFARLFEFWR